MEELLQDAAGDEKTGIALIAKALEAPIKQIALNAGLEGAVFLDKVKSNKSANFGFDAAKEEYCTI